MSKLLYLLFFSFALFDGCEEKKNKQIISNEFLALYWATLGQFNTCQTILKYKVVENPFLSAKVAEIDTHRIYNLKEGDKLFMRNLSTNSACISATSLYICDSLTNNWLLDIDVVEKLCLNISSNLIEVNTIEKEKVCNLNLSVLSKYNNSILFNIGSNGETKFTKPLPECLYQLEVKQ